MIGCFEVGHLSLLGGLVLIAALVVMGQRSVDSLSPRRRLMSLVIRSLLLATLIGALARAALEPVAPGSQRTERRRLGLRAMGPTAVFSD